MEYVIYYIPAKISIMICKMNYLIFDFVCKIFHTYVFIRIKERHRYLFKFLSFLSTRNVGFGFIF